MDRRAGVPAVHTGHGQPPQRGRHAGRGVEHQQAVLVRAGRVAARDRARPAWRGRRAGRVLAVELPVLAGRPDLRGHERDPAQRRRRATARSSQGVAMSEAVVSMSGTCEASNGACEAANGAYEELGAHEGDFRAGPGSKVSGSLVAMWKSSGRTERSPGSARKPSGRTERSPGRTRKPSNRTERSPDKTGEAPDRTRKPSSRTSEAAGR